MTFSGLNFSGVLLAFAISFISGGIWFGPKTFYPVWLKAKGIESGVLTAKQNKPIILFGGTIVGVLFQTLTVGLIVNSLQKGHSNFGIIDGAGVGFALGVGIGMFASLSHRLFSGENFKAWLIETVNDAINLTIAGAIIAFFN